MKRSVVLKTAAGAAVALLAVAGCSSSRPAESSTTAAPTTAATSAATSASSAGSSTSEATSAGSSTSDGSSAVAPTSASKNYNISFIQGVAGDEFYISMQCGIEAEAAKLGVTVNTQGAQKFDPTLQSPVLDGVVASKPDAILIAPTDVTAMQAPLKAAADAGIKVVLVDTTVDDPSFAVSQVSSDNLGGGKAAFDAIKQLNPDGGKVLVISVDPGISTTDARVKGFEDAANADSAFTYLGVQYSHNDPATAAQLVSAALQKDPDIVGVFATNLFAAEGTAQGIREAGKQGAIDVVGFDAGPNQVEALKEGTVQALVAQQPATIGTDGLDQAVAALDGGTITPVIQTGFSIITQENVEGNEAVYQSSC
ncbi:substrate-binding domain-containing protein [Nakamurella sp. YIM 132087]|uniref:Substrate-binding domain-containing protein n=1 Tax=Nakamurella alba TaxID=2665158 RepID=A0A7K1FQU0_9ACTN|nr:ABC transporter substrate-binding protein [Nakamurella alba]MTD15623.1 substrate-binding domain-containing protein [Nakamurella alba]